MAQACEHKDRGWLPYPLVRFGEDRDVWICCWFCSCGASGKEEVSDYEEAMKLIGG